MGIRWNYQYTVADHDQVRDTCHTGCMGLSFVGANFGFGSDTERCTASSLLSKSPHHSRWNWILLPIHLYSADGLDDFLLVRTVCVLICVLCRVLGFFNLAAFVTIACLLFHGPTQVVVGILAFPFPFLFTLRLDGTHDSESFLHAVHGLWHIRKSTSLHRCSVVGAYACIWRDLPGAPSVPRLCHSMRFDLELCKCRFMLDCGIGPFSIPHRIPHCVLNNAFDSSAGHCSPSRVPQRSDAKRVWAYYHQGFALGCAVYGSYIAGLLGSVFSSVVVERIVRHPRGGVGILVEKLWWSILHHKYHERAMYGTAK